MTAHSGIRPAAPAGRRAGEEIVRQAHSPSIPRIGYTETHRAGERGLGRVFVAKNLA